MDLKLRAKQIQKFTDDLPRRIRDAQKAATMRAVEKATEMTTPANGIQRGVNMLSGQMSQHWALDSNVDPVMEGHTYTTELKNDMPYASYVNDGHRLDRHFVPGLYIDDNGMISRNMDGTGGIVVGTKTTWVNGVGMAEEAGKVYRETLQSELEGLVKILE